MQQLPAHIHRYDPPIAGIEIIYEALPRPTSPYDSSWMADSDTMLVHAALLADQAEELSHRASQVVLESQICANELQFMHTPVGTDT